MTLRKSRMLLLVLPVVSLLFAASGCQDRCVSCVVPTTPEAQPCTFAVAPLSQFYPYPGGSGTVAVTTQSGCAWSAASGVSWIGIASISGGMVTYVVHANPAEQRVGTIAVAGQTVTITQETRPHQPCTGPCNSTPPPPPPTPPPSCTYAVQQSTQHFTYQGGNGGFSVSTSPASCAWSAVSHASWIAITGGSPGVGNGTVSYIVAGNGGAARNGTISVGGKTVKIAQSGQ